MISGNFSPPLASPSIHTYQSDHPQRWKPLWRSQHRLGSTARPSNPRKRVVRPPHRASRPLAQSPHPLWQPPAFYPTNCGSTSDYLGLERTKNSTNRRHTNSCFQTRHSYIRLTFNCVLHVCLSSLYTLLGSPMGFFSTSHVPNGSNFMNYQHHKWQQRDQPQNQNLQMHGRPFLHPDLNASTINSPICIIYSIFIHCSDIWRLAQPSRNFCHCYHPALISGAWHAPAIGGPWHMVQESDSTFSKLYMHIHRGIGDGAAGHVFLVIICCSFCSKDFVMVHKDKIVLSHGMPLGMEQGTTMDNASEPPASTPRGHSRPARRDRRQRRPPNAARRAVRDKTRRACSKPRWCNGSHPVRCMDTLLEREFPDDSQR